MQHMIHYMDTQAYFNGKNIKKKGILIFVLTKTIGVCVAKTHKKLDAPKDQLIN